MKPYLEKIKEHFESPLTQFDQQNDRFIPKFEEFEEWIVRTVPFSAETSLKMLDLGVGTGHTAIRMLEKFPNAHLTGVDFSKNMIRCAKDRLSPYANRIRLVESELTEFEFGGTYDLIYSAITLHHLNHEDKKKLFLKICKHLNKGGCFINGDNIKLRSEFAHKRAHGFYIDFIKKNLKGAELKHWLEHVESDNMAVLDDEVEWLRAAGFREIDVVWMYWDWATYIAFK